MPSTVYSSLVAGGKPQTRWLRKDAVPSIFFWRKPTTPASAERQTRWQRRNILKPQELFASSCDDSHSEEDMEEELLEEDITIAAECTVTVLDEEDRPGISVGTQTDPPPPRSDVKYCDAGTDPMPKVHMSISNFIDDPAGIHDFTGLENYSRFQFTLATLGPAAHQLNYMYGNSPDRLSTEDLYFIVLIKLRKHYTNFELSRMFNVTEADVYNIFCTWVRFLSLQWREVSLWPNKDLIKFYAPAGFKKEFPSTRVIVDGTECPIKKPGLPRAQQATFSTYKNKNTVKVLAGIAPGGLVSYMSPSYGGSASDRQIVERSSLPEMCDGQDSVMSDKGFDVQDIFAPYNIAVNIPTFSGKKTA